MRDHARKGGDLGAPCWPPCWGAGTAPAPQPDAVTGVPGVGSLGGGMAALPRLLALLACLPAAAAPQRLRFVSTHLVGHQMDPVSYTHLTLPTIYSV